MAKHKKVHGHVPGPKQPQQNLCFACGPDNPDGMHLKFVLDEERQRFVCRFRLPQKFWGPPKHCHGGIVATILDEAMGKVNRIRHVIAVTSEMNVQYLKMVPLGKWCTVESWEDRVEGREHYNVAEIKDQQGEVLARSTGKFIAVDPERMFKAFLKAKALSARKQGG